MSDDDVDARRARDLENLYRQSPLHEALGLSLKVDEGGSVAIHYDGSPGGRNRRGNSAGATTAAMIDSLVMQSAMLRLTEGDSVTTVELKVNYLRAGAEGEPLVAHGRLVHFGRSTVVGYGEVVDTQGRAVAVGLVTLNVRPRPS